MKDQVLFGWSPKSILTLTVSGILHAEPAEDIIIVLCVEIFQAISRVKDCASSRITTG